MDFGYTPVFKRSSHGHNFCSCRSLLNSNKSKLISLWRFRLAFPLWLLLKALDLARILRGYMYQYCSIIVVETNHCRSLARPVEDLFPRDTYTLDGNRCISISTCGSCCIAPLCFRSARVRCHSRRVDFCRSNIAQPSPQNGLDPSFVDQTPAQHQEAKGYSTTKSGQENDVIRMWRLSRIVSTRLLFHIIRTSHTYEILPNKVARILVVGGIDVAIFLMFLLLFLLFRASL